MLYQKLKILRNIFPLPTKFTQFYMRLAYLLFCLLFSSFHGCFSITCMLETISTAIPVNGDCM